MLKRRDLEKKEDLLATYAHHQKSHSLSSAEKLD